MNRIKKFCKIGKIKTLYEQFSTNRKGLIKLDKMRKNEITKEKYKEYLKIFIDASSKNSINFFWKNKWFKDLDSIKICENLFK